MEILTNSRVGPMSFFSSMSHVNQITKVDWNSQETSVNASVHHRQRCRHKFLRSGQLSRIQLHRFPSTTSGEPHALSYCGVIQSLMESGYDAWRHLNLRYFARSGDQKLRTITDDETRSMASRSALSALVA
eukprot:4762959-Amphidinium_carterae.1